MKKLTGWLIIITCSIFLLIFGIAIIVIIPGLLTNQSNVRSSMADIVRSLFGMGVAMFLFILGLRYGIKNVRNSKAIEIVAYPEELAIRFSGQIGYTDYRNLILGLTYKKPFYLGLMAVILLNLFAFITDQKTVTNYFYTNYFLLIIFGIFMLSPFFTFYKIKKQYHTNKIFQEILEYSLNNESIHIKGDTVNSTQKWSHFFKIKETKNFFMLYQGAGMATLLDKKMFNNRDLEEFRKFVKSIKAIRE